MTITVLNILPDGTQTLENREVPDDYFAVPQDGGQSATDETAKGPQADADTAALGAMTSVPQDGGQSATDGLAAGGEATSGAKSDSEAST